MWSVQVLSGGETGEWTPWGLWMVLFLEPREPLWGTQSTAWGSAGRIYLITKNRRRQNLLCAVAPPK